MQTFLPYPDMRRSLECLDNVRLNKQVVETFQCINANIQGPPIRVNRKVVSGSSWYNHPVAKMWSNNINGLRHYLNVSIDVCAERGIIHDKIKKDLLADPNDLPDWWGSEMFHLSHQSNLVRKVDDFYGPQFPNMHHKMPYFWPVTIKCRKTGAYDPKSGLWVKLNFDYQRDWFQQYLTS